MENCQDVQKPRCSLLVAGLGHDLGHPGLNNGFLSEAESIALDIVLPLGLIEGGP